MPLPFIRPCFPLLLSSSFYRLYDRVGSCQCGDVSRSNLNTTRHETPRRTGRQGDSDAAALTRRMGRRRTSYAGVLAGALLIVAALPSASGDPGAPRPRLRGSRWEALQAEMMLRARGRR